MEFIYMIIEFFLKGPIVPIRSIIPIRSIVPDSLKLMFHVPDFVPRFESNPVLCNYAPGCIIMTILTIVRA